MRSLIALLISLSGLLPVSAAAIEFRDYYSAGEISAYQLALKRKDFRASIHWKPLFVAAADNADLNTVRWMLENGVKADTADTTGRTGLFHLARPDAAKIPAGNAAVARLLLLNGADANRFAGGWSVTRALVSGNRDVEVLKVALAHGANPDGHPMDIYPPVCSAATPAILDALVAAGAALGFEGRTDIHNVADCLSGEDMSRKEHKAMLKYLETVYGIVPTGEKADEAVVAAAASKPVTRTLSAGTYLYTEQAHARVGRGEPEQIVVDHVAVKVDAGLTRDEVIAQRVQPENFRRYGWLVDGASLQRCAGDCGAELAALKTFAANNRLQREYNAVQTMAVALAP